MKELDNNSIFDIFNVFDFFSLEGIINAGSGEYNLCLVVEKDASGWYGYEFSSYGIANPTHTKDGVLLFSLKWNDTGDFILRWGDSGDEQLTDINTIVVKSKEGTHSGIAIWRAVGKEYKFNDVEWATELINAYGAGEFNQCFMLTGSPDNFIHYSFNEMLTGVR